MSKLNLVFTARDIAKIEDEFDASIEKIIAGFKLKTLVQFLRFGLRGDNDERLELSEDALYDLIDSKIKEVGKIEIQIQIIEALMDAGFLPKAIETSQLRENLSAAVAETSKITGKTKK